MQVLTIVHADTDALKELAAQAESKLPGATIAILGEIAWKMPVEPTDSVVMKIADVLEPRDARDFEYAKFLRGLALGLDSLHISEGEKLMSPRWSVKKVTDRLNKAFLDGSVRKHDLFKWKAVYDIKGVYISTKYWPTDLGSKVISEIGKRGKLDWPHSPSKAPEVQA